MGNRWSISNLPSKAQRPILEKEGLFAVKACPGSGKTYSVAVRLAKLLSEWKLTHQGIATLSFTNVAWEEIQKYLFEITQSGNVIRFPHFLGTLDSFFNQYIFLPFGHLLLGCKDRPDLIGPPVNDWEPIGNGWFWGRGNEVCNQRGCRLNHFSYDVNGNLIAVINDDIFNNCPRNHTTCTSKKQQVLRQGYATQADANYYTLKVLQDFPQIAKSLAQRFPVLLIDEAQDSSEIQMAIIELLIENGISEVMLIGDPDQSIYEWRRAKPELFVNKYNEWQENSITFNENRRSSQQICDFSYSLSTLEKPAVSKNEEATNLGIEPEVWGYPGNDYQAIIETFTNRCRELSLDAANDDLVVLVRGKPLLNKIKGIFEMPINASPWREGEFLTKQVCLSKYLFDKGEFKEAFSKLQRAICKHIREQNILSKEDLDKTIASFGFKVWRVGIYKMLCKLPSTRLELGEWIYIANSLLEDLPLLNNTSLSIKRNSRTCRYRELSFEDVFAVSQQQYKNTIFRAGTVHSVKGESCDAVLLILKRRSATRNYVNMLDESVSENEELRIVYVALTRPRKALFLAVPEQDRKAWEKAFNNHSD